MNQVISALERTKVDLAKAQFALEKAVKIAEIRNNIEAVLLNIFDVYRKQSKIVEAAEKNTSKNKRDRTKRELEIMWESG